MKRLRDACNDQIRNKLRTGITQVLQNLRTAIEGNEAFMANGWRIGRLCVTVPNQWTLEFEEVYTRLLAQAFDWTLGEARSRILYYTETDALAHFLLSTDHYVQVAKLLRGQEQQRVVLVLDFGGHNLVRFIHCPRMNITFHLDSKVLIPHHRMVRFSGCRVPSTRNPSFSDMGKHLVSTTSQQRQQLNGSSSGSPFN